MATPVGRSNVSGPLPATPSLPSHQNFAVLAQFEDFRPITTPAAFLAGMPSTVSLSLTSRSPKGFRRSQR